ncbi:MAG: dihydroorotase [Lachnospiraceae bacterium]|nr:dihydroorotase [Lachnospiraceae bacterium]
MDLLIQNAHILDPLSGLDTISDLYLKDGLICSVGSHPDPLPKETALIDANGLIAAPGFVDIHVHFRDPGFPEKETVETGAAAAVAGGYTTVVMMANTKPVVDCVSVLSALRERIREVNQTTPLHILPTASVTKGLKGKELSDLAAVSAAGAAGFTDDGIPLMDPVLLEEAFTVAAKLQKPVSLHEEDPRLITENGINAGQVSREMGLAGSPREAEISMISRDIGIAAGTGATVNIQHISTREGVELIREARKKYPNIHAEATPHHFSLTDRAVLAHGTMAKMNPPLRTEEDRLAVIEGLRDGTIESIATDHAPHTAAEKAKPFPEAPSGIIGLETALPLGITHLVKGGHLGMMELMSRMSAGPAALYGIETGIRPGAPADLVLFDPDEKQTITSFCSRSSNSPFMGEALTGVVKYTICGGRIAYRS